jgi:uncharacterized protein
LTPSWIELLFPDHRPLVYGSALAGRQYATQWTLYRGVGSDRLHEIEFLLEIDPSAAGSGGALLHQRMRLWTTDTLDPVCYIMEAMGARTTLDFEHDAVNVELPDHSRQTVPRSGALFVMDGNLPGHLALVYAGLAVRGLIDSAASLRVPLFLAPQLVTVPYEIVPMDEAEFAAGRWHRTSHNSEVLLDTRGMMREARTPKLSHNTWLEESGPSVPAWPDDLTPDAPRLAYVPPQHTSFRLEDISIPGPVTPIGGTLSIPRGSGPFPGVLFLSGSGMHDRHGIAGEIDIGTHEIMDNFAEHGFVGLRFDTRGAGTTRLGSDFLDRGLVSDIADAQACLACLRARAETAGRPLFLIGHSQGGTIALAIASGKETRGLVSGVVLMATAGRDLADVIADQLTEQGDVIGLAPEQVAQQIKDFRCAVRLARSDLPWEPGKIPDFVLAMFRTRTWLQEVLQLHTTELITDVQSPVLVCQGTKDFQISAARDAEPLVAAARAAGVDCSYALFSDLDHLFKRCVGRSTLATYFDRRPVSPAFLDRVRSFLAEGARVSG